MEQKPNKVMSEKPSALETEDIRIRGVRLREVREVTNTRDHNGHDDVLRVILDDDFCEALGKMKSQRFVIRLGLSLMHELLRKSSQGKIGMRMPKIAGGVRFIL